MSIPLIPLADSIVNLRIIHDKVSVENLLLAHHLAGIAILAVFGTTGLILVVDQFSKYKRCLLNYEEEIQSAQKGVRIGFYMLGIALGGAIGGLYAAASMVAFILILAVMYVLVWLCDQTVGAIRFAFFKEDY